MPSYDPSCRLIGIGRSLAAPPSHTTRHTDHVPGRLGRFGRGNLCTPTGASSIVSPRSVSSHKGRCPTDALPLFLNKRPLLSFNPLSGNRSGLPLRQTQGTIPSADFSSAINADFSTFSQFQSHATSQGTEETSRGKTQNLPRVNAGFIKHAPLRMEGFVVTCPLAPSVPHLLSGSCSSPRAFGLGFLQTPPHDDALALFLTFGSAKTWFEDFHLVSSVPCPAHTAWVSGARQSVRWSRLFGAHHSFFHILLCCLNEASECPVLFTFVQVRHLIVL